MVRLLQEGGTPGRRMRQPPLPPAPIPLWISVSLLCHSSMYSVQRSSLRKYYALCVRHGGGEGRGGEGRGEPPEGARQCRAASGSEWHRIVRRGISRQYLLKYYCVSLTI